MSKQSYNPPEFINDASEYPEYKRRLKRWSRITKVVKAQQAEVVVYHLEKHPSGIQDKIDTALGDKIIDKEDGLDKLLTYLDTIYAEDDMMEAWKKYKEFVRLKKEKDQPINEFIAVFDGKYMKAKESGSDFSDTVLAFNLLEACELTDTDEKFVLTAVDFQKGKDEKNMLNQVKASLRKFQSRKSIKSDVRMKLEVDETLVSNIKETLVSEGWTPPSQPKTFGDVRSKVPLNSPNYKGKKNPLGNDGKTLKCFNCNSEFHFMDKCNQKVTPKYVTEKERRRKKVNFKDSESATLLTLLKKNAGYSYEEEEAVMVAHDEEELCLLIEEAGNRGVLDTACSKTVAGLEWISEFLNDLPQNIVKDLEVQESMKVYQFGGGEKRKSLGCIKLPVVVGDKKVSLIVELIDASIPLLIGSNAMEAANVQLDFKNYEATFFDQEVKMYKEGTGHFCIDLISENISKHVNDVNERETRVQTVLASAAELDEKDIKKLHHLFGHVSADKLKKFVAKTGKLSKEVAKVIEEILSTCDACKKTRKKVPRPKVAIPRADAPNEIVTVDLKEYDRNCSKRKYICYIIDMHSRMTVAGFISEKKPEEIVNVLLKQWISHYGLMKCLHSDIGGEMSNELIEDVAANLGVKLTTTSAYSPHQNGINERNHQTVDLMMTRMLESDPKLCPDLALCWALQARNSLDNSYGFSSFQLHIGYNPVLPSATRDGPPAMEGITKSKTLANHINAMHAAREAFIEAESSSRLKKALKSKVFPRGEDLEEGDWIYYKKDSIKSSGRVWRGPSQVVATNGKKLFIDQGARLGTVNRDDAVKFGEELWRIDDVMEDSFESRQTMEVDNGVVSDSSVREVLSSGSEAEDSDDNTDGEQTVVIEGERTADEENSVVEYEARNVMNTPEEDTTNIQYTHNDVKKNDVIRYKLPEAMEWETAKVLSRAGKATGKNKYWWNVELLNTGVSKSLNTENCEELQMVSDCEEEVFEEALVVLIPRHLHSQPDCIGAKEKELENWDNFGTYVEVEDVGQEKLNTNWVIVQKGDAIKARLCVRGDQEKDKEDIRTDSPTVHKTSIKLFYLLAALNDWKIKTADVMAAFLQGADLDRDVYVRPPKERRVPGVLWKMVKEAYGLVDASRGFYLELEKTLLELGCVVSKHDPAMYMYFGNGAKLDGMILTHVDDMLHGSGGSDFEKIVMEPLRARFLFGKEEESDFKYVGSSVSKKGDSIVVCQDGYIDALAMPELEEFIGMKGDDFVSEESQVVFRELVGKIGWLANTTRPDLCFNKLVLSTKVGKATVTDVKLAAKIIKKVKCESTQMKFPNLGPVTEWTLQAYGDGAHKSLPDKVSSCGGQVIVIANKKENLKCVVSWRSRKLRRVVTSSTAAEALAVNDALDEAVYVKEVLKELIGETAVQIPIEVFTDSRNLYRSVMSTSLVDNPRLRSDVAKLKESMKIGEMSKLWKIDGSDMIADCLTKKGACSKKLMNILHTCKP